MRRIIAFLCFALLVSSFFTSCDFLLDIGTEEPAAVLCQGRRRLLRSELYADTVRKLRNRYSGGYS